jgi:hypothetical protein
LLEDLFFDELIDGLWNYHYLNKEKFVSPFMLRDLKIFEQFTGMDKSVLARNDNWRRWGLSMDNGVINYADAFHGIQAHRLINLIKSIGKPVVTVLDLGSGYGGLADLLCRWSDKPINMILVDIPLNLATAYGYLANIYGENRVKLIADTDQLHQNHLSGPLDETQFVLIPSIYVENIAAIQEIEILHNAASFSEMDFETVEYYLDKLVSSDLCYLVETNSNLLGSRNYGNFKETLSRDIEALMTTSHDLIARFPENHFSRYVTSIYKNRSR